MRSAVAPRCLQRHASQPGAVFGRNEAVKDVARKDGVAFLPRLHAAALLQQPALLVRCRTRVLLASRLTIDASAAIISTGKSLPSSMPRLFFRNCVRVILFSICGECASVLSMMIENASTNAVSRAEGSGQKVVSLLQFCMMRSICCASPGRRKSEGRSAGPRQTARMA